MMMTMRGRKTVLAGVALAACMVLLFAATHTTAQLVTPTMEVGELCLVTEVPEVPEDTTDEEVALATTIFEGAFERYFNLFLPCVISTAWNPSWVCCNNLNSIWGAYEEADYPNCLCLDGWFGRLVDSFRGQYDITTLYNTCAARYPRGFTVNFDAPATPGLSYGTQRCTPDRVKLPESYINPFLNITAESLGISEEDQDLIAGAIVDELEAAAAEATQGGN